MLWKCLRQRGKWLDFLFYIKRWNKIKLTSFWLSSCQVLLPCQDMLQSIVEVCLGRDSRVIQSDSSGRKQANRDWWNHLQDWHQVILHARNSSTPKESNRILKGNCHLLSAIQISHFEAQHQFHSCYSYENFICVICRIRAGGVILFSQARIQVLCNHFWETKPPPKDGSKEGQSDWELKEVFFKTKSLYPHLNLIYLFY